jgi:hypothetical protein
LFEPALLSFRDRVLGNELRHVGEPFFEAGDHV